MNKRALTISTLTLFLLTTASSSACHHFSHWTYPWPQSCRAARQAEPALKIAENKPIPASLIPEPDLRSPSDLSSQAEHDRALSFHHDTINALMLILHTQQNEATPK